MRKMLESIVEIGEKKTLEDKGILAERDLRAVETGENMIPEWKESDISPFVYDAEERQKLGGLSACNYKCITSYCQPPDLAKGIGSSSPHAPNSSVGHS